MGIFALRTGKMDSGCNTFAPMYASSRNSLYVSTSITEACGTTRGSHVINPSTSVKFSYSDAPTARAIIAPYISDPPRENVTISP